MISTTELEVCNEKTNICILYSSNRVLWNACRLRQ